jgi:hypothetical protein
MKSGKCPKCGSENIYRSPKRRPAGYSGNKILIKLGWFANKGANLTHYVCEHCNYIESYVADEKSMQSIREEWTSLNPRKSKRKNDE